MTEKQKIDAWTKEALENPEAVHLGSYIAGRSKSLEEKEKRVRELGEALSKEKTKSNYLLYGIELLKTLCNLKHYKDTVGKDSLYEKEQPQAWKEANDFLNTLVNYNH